MLGAGHLSLGAGCWSLVAGLSGYWSSLTDYRLISVFGCNMIYFLLFYNTHFHFYSNIGMKKHLFSIQFSI